MFEKEGQRFLTPGIKEEVPLEVQLLLWHLLDASNWQRDYLQIFELYKENHTNKLSVIHRQEEPEQQRKVSFQLGKYAKELQALPSKIWVIDDDDHQTMNIRRKGNEKRSQETGNHRIGIFSQRIKFFVSNTGY